MMPVVFTERGGFVMSNSCAALSGRPSFLLLVAVIVFTFPMTSTGQSSIPVPLLFSGNATVVAPPLQNTLYGNGLGQFALLARAPDCSMYAVLAEVSAGSPPFTAQLIQADYQDNLHDLAGLKTKADQFPDGCANPMGGNPAYLTYGYAGQTTTGNHIFVMAPYNQSGTLEIYNGKFTPFNQQVVLVQTLTTSFPNVQGVAAADLNGDGAQDLIVTLTSDAGAGQVVVFLGHGDGTFESAPAFTYNTPPNTVASYFSIADVNNDGKLDVVAVISAPNGSGKGSLQVLFGQGNGQFTTGPNTPLTASANLPVLVADLNGDGHQDVIVTDGEVMLGDGTGKFTPARL